jgi:hypothetical protein
MSDFKLPSGRIVRTEDTILWGQELHIISVGLQNPEEYHYAKCAAIVPGLKREEIFGLSREDGRALSKEINRIYDGGTVRSVEAERPFANGSRRKSRA